MELQEETKEESDEEEEDDEESGRLRFKTERKEGTIIRLSDVTRERRNIPETLGKIFQGGLDTKMDDRHFWLQTSSVTALRL